MSAIRIRGGRLSKWSRLAAVAVVLASSAVVHAQSNEEKEKQKAAEKNKKAPPPAKKDAAPAPARKDAPAAQTSTPPPPARKNDAPATPLNNRQNVTPANNAPVRPNVGGGGTDRPVENSPVHPPVIRKGGAVEATPLNNRGNAAGRVAAPAAPRADFQGANNTQVHFSPSGQPRMVQTHGMTIVHAPGGSRQVVVERPDHTVIMTNAGGHGFVQRPYVVNNVTFVQRTYYVGGAPYVRVYRPFLFGGISLNIYVPGHYYAPGFYAWAYNPWATPVVYNWGWGGSPWYGYYGGWFTPYPTYANATFWLTDYVIAESLQQAYNDRMAAASNGQPYPQGATPLSPDVKQQIANEVTLQLNEERASAQNPNMAPTGAPSFLTDNAPHVFVVSSGLFVMANGGGECPVTEGDVLQMLAPPPPGSPTVNVAVLASKGQDCRRGSRVNVGITDLADMVSQMRATIDQGLGQLQKHQGGIPAPPPAAMAPPATPTYAAAAPPPDPNVQQELTQQSQSATQAESDALNQAQAAAPAGAAPAVNISLGMSIDDVVAAMGQPTQIADLGSKKTYFYANMKVIFVDGKVSDVQ